MQWNLGTYLSPDELKTSGLPKLLLVDFSNRLTHTKLQILGLRRLLFG